MVGVVLRFYGPFNNVSAILDQFCVCLDANLSVFEELKKEGSSLRFSNREEICFDTNLWFVCIAKCVTF